MVSIINKNPNTRLLDAGNILHVNEAALLLQDGHLVALPTETVYGLAANGLKSEAIARVYAAKKRPLKNPLILHVNSLEKAYELFDFSSKEKHRFELLARAFWPGPLTIIGKKAFHVPEEAVGHLPTVAVRIPANKATHTILHQLPFPLVMPSANLSTRPSPTSADHVFRTLNGRIHAVLDDGPCPIGIESSVIKIDQEKAILFRPGVITKSMLEACLKETVLVEETLSLKEPTSPGQCFLHYSPRISSVGLLAKSDVDAHWPSLDIILIKRSDFLALRRRYGARDPKALTLVLSDEPEKFARELYDALYQCEEFPEKKLWIVLPRGRDEAWASIIDRLTRSAGIKELSRFKVVESIGLKYG